MQETTETVDRSKEQESTLYDRIKETLAVASQLVIASPLKLPPKVVVVAKYLALALGVLEAVENGASRGKGADDEDH